MLLCALVGPSAAAAQDAGDGDGASGLYEPFPEAAAGERSSLFGAESGRNAARRAFVARARQVPPGGGAATIRAGGEGGLLGLPPLLGPLLCAVGVLAAVHAWRRRRAALGG